MFKSLCCAAALISFAGLPVAGHSRMGVAPGWSDMSAATSSPVPSTAPADAARAQWEARQMQLEGHNRQIALKRDTDKLLELVTELKRQVDATGPDILSVDVVKRAQEIEKLAKSVKEKMKGD